MSDDAFSPTELLSLMETWSGLLIRPAPDIAAAIYAAQLAHERGYLVIAGVEGAGKSTLVNALLGADVTPVSKFDPGTVAPIQFAYGSNPEPVYRVVLSAAAGQANTDGLDRGEFEQFLLQLYNRDNEKGVLRGEVALDSRILHSGLRIIDMPGSHGMSQEVAEQAQNHLSSGAFTVVLVNMGRLAMSSLVEVVAELLRSRDDVRIAALVSNEDDLSVLQPDRLEENLRMRRGAMKRLLLDKLPPGSLQLQESDVYVIHLPTFAPDSGGGRVPLELEKEQWHAFTEAVTEQVQRNGLDATVGASLRALQSLASGLAQRGRLLASLRACQVELRTTLAPVKLIVEDAEKAVAEAEARLRDADWLAFAETVRQEAAKLKTVLNQCESTAEAADPGLPHKEAKQIERQVNSALGVCVSSLKAARAQSTADLTATLVSVYDESIERYLAEIPVGGLSDYPVTGVPLADIKVGKYQFKSVTDEVNEAVEDSAFLGFLVGLMVGLPVLPAYAVYYLRGGNRGLSLRLVRGLRQRVQVSLDSDAGGALRNNWLLDRKLMVDNYVMRLERSLEQLAKEAARPSTQAAKNLELQQYAIDAACRELAMRESKLKDHQSR
jgi:energy-coupling factor transporter ATP-binding protein EcfA2